MKQKTETGRGETPHHHRQGAEIICSKERNLKVNYLLSPESGAWLEPSGSSGGSWTGHCCLLGMTIGEGVKELLPGGRGSNSVSNSRIAYPAPAGKLDCQQTFLNCMGKSESKDDANFLLWKNAEPANERGRKFANPEERSPLDDAGQHHHQLISSSSSDTGALTPSQSS